MEDIMPGGSSINKPITFLLATLIILSTTFGCSDQRQQEITIALNPWPGYEPLILAETKGFFKEFGVNMKLVQLESLSEVQRAYLNGHIDGMTSTMIEVVQAEHLGTRPLKVIMAVDYSNGGDVIVAKKSITAVTDLKGKIVGAEVSSLGIFVLERALATHGLSLDDVELVNLNQPEGVTIPNEIVDFVLIAKDVLDANPELPRKMRKIWQKTLDTIAANPAPNYAIMADRQGITPEEFQGILADLVVLSKTDQDKLFKEGTTLKESADAACKTLVKVKALETDCSKQKNLIIPF